MEKSWIYKRKSAGGLQVEKKKHDFGTTPPKVNIRVVLIHQYYQQIIRWQEQQLICCVKKIRNAHISGGARTTNILVYSWRKIQVSSWVATTWQASKQHVPVGFGTSSPRLWIIKKICKGRVPCKVWPELDQGRNSCGSDEGSPQVSFIIRRNCSFCCWSTRKIGIEPSTSGML